MKKLLLLLLLAGTGWLNSFAQPLDQPASTLEARIDSLVKTEMEQKNIPGLSIGIVNGDTVFLSKAYGYADLENRAPATPNTVYQLGSVTKVFTGNLLARLADRKLLRLDDPVAGHFPSSVSFPEDPNGRELSLQHLATHSAALPRYPHNLDRMDPEPIRGFSRQKMFRAINRFRPDTLYGTNYHYSNFGYGVLGVAMERLSKRSLGELLEEHIFIPNRMTMTSLALDATLEEKLATPYLEVNPPKVTAPWQMGSLSAAGNIFSTVADMNSFMRYLLEENEWNRIQRHAYLKINDSWSYGLGCFVIRSPKWDTTVIYHGGDIDGYASSLTLYPEYGLGITVLTNYGEGRVVSEVFNRLGNLITDTLLRAGND